MILPLAAWGVRADEERILADLERFFTGEAAGRAALVERIESDPAWDRARLGEWLHRLDLYPRLTGEREEIEVAVGFGHVRKITLRLPRGYTPERAWPLIYTFHPSGGSGPSVLQYAARLLGEAAEDFVLAAPTHYRQTILDAPPPFTPEHPVILRRLRRTVHVASDRVYVLGYSTGGYTSWTLAMVHADELAGAVPVASAYSLPADVEGLWEAMTPNFAHLPILHVWGGRDPLPVPGFEMRDPNVGTIAELNRRFSPLIDKLGLDVVDHQVPRAGHGVEVPRGELMRVLGERRVRYPESVRHLFRHVHQARAYWLEGHVWEGDWWGEPGRKIARRRGESFAAAAGRIVLPLLGELRGEIDGQILRVERRHLEELTVWLGDGMIDWSLPIRLELGGETVFAGRVEPDLAVCLNEAARTYDFDRLRWAGLYVDGSQVRPVTAETEFPPLVRVP